ncbi:hypothetical protein ACQCSX_04315 [Pseudarthrobacter sp. P1]|uniref:hypothetical protein n=1 Tax=Pseudarthrobacter sp. P1 TaxID=3418418 RepID=UPI003CF10C37
MSTPSKYRKKPVVIEAMQLNLFNSDAIEGFVGGDLGLHPEGGIIIATLEGPMRARIGDFIIKGVAGEFYPCRSDIFAATYEEVAE